MNIKKVTLLTLLLLVLLMTCSAISAADNSTTDTSDASNTHSSISTDTATIQTAHDTSTASDTSHSSTDENIGSEHSDTSTSKTQTTSTTKDSSSSTDQSTSKVTDTTQSTTSSSIDKSTNTQSSSTDTQSSSTNTQSSNSQIDNNDNYTTTTQNTTTTQSSTSNVNISNSNQVENSTKSISTNLVDEKTQLKTSTTDDGITYTVYDYTDLYDTVNNIKSLSADQEYTIILDDSQGSTYYVTEETGQMTWGATDGSQTAQKLVIDGNGVTIEGLGVDTSKDAENRFFILHDGYSLTLKDMKITNFYSYGYAGAIYADGGTLIVDNTEFLENVAGAHGGAIYINGENAVFESIDSTFLENTASGTFGNTFGHGGAIYIETSDSVTITNSEFTYNNARLGGAIRIGGGAMIITGSKFTYNTATWENGDYGFGGALYNFNSDSLTVTGSSFIGNQAIGEYNTIYGFGGAIYNNQTLGAITIENSEFLENSATNLGGALYINETGDVEITNTEFYKNTVDLNGGAIFNGISDSLTIEDSKFYSNSAGTEEIEGNEGRGGAIYIDQTGPISIDNVEFLVNTATRSGGAIYNSESESLTIENSKFTQNVATVNGGAIHNSDTLTITETQFTQNEAEYGGAIYDNGKEIEITGSDFISNTADVGGAIYLEVSDGSLTITGSTFLQNIANNNGGAISTYGTSEIKSSQFTGNTATTAGGAVYNTGELTITDTSFSLNKATSETDGVGGAIANYGNGKITIEGSSTFSNNEALNGGAISNTGGSISLESARFTDNEATHGGAIVNYAGTITISGTRFLENSATSGGAIYNDGGTLEISDSSRFSENSATDGGVIYVDGDNVKITDSTFSENSATDGAVIYIVDGVVDITSSTFKENSAENGGVIYNGGSSTTITSSEFTDNSANEDGGAIYNTGSLTITGESDDESVFSLNSANNGAAIYSTGTLTVSGSEFTENTATNFGGALYNTATATLNDNDFIDNQGLYNNTIYNSNSLTMTGNYIKMYDYYTDAYTNLEMYSPIIDTTLTEIQNIFYYIYNPSGALESIEEVTVDTTQKTYVTYRFNNEGVYKVDIIYKGSDNTIEFNVNVYRASSSITVSATDRLLPTETVTITGELYGEGEPINNGEVTLFIDGKEVGSTNTDENGEYKFELTTTTTGETNFDEGIVRVDLGYNTVVVVYNDESGIYETVSAITEFEVYKIVTNLEITKTSDSIVIDLTDASEEPISNEEVEITITKDDELVYSGSLTTTEYGEITIQLSDFEEGAYIIEAKYEGSEIYYDSQDVKAFIIRDGAYLTVEVDNPTVKVGDTVTATITIEGIEEIDPDSLEVTINGNIISSDQITDLGNGVFEVTYEPTRDGEYIVIATYTDPNEQHDTISDYAVFDAEKIDTVTVVTSITGSEGSSVDLTAYVFDVNLQIVDEGEVLFIIGNNIVRDSSGNILYAQVHDGVATLPYTITEDVDSYDLMAIYTGTDKYYGSYSENSAKLTVGEPETELIPTTTIVNSVAGVQGDTVDLTATVYDNEGNLVDRGEVIFMIDGRIVVGTDGNILADIEDGVAKLPYLLTGDVGEYTITAVYIANDKYLESSSINEGLLVIETQPASDMIPTITVVDSITGHTGDTVELTATVVDHDGNSVNEGKVTFKVNGVTVCDDSGETLYVDVVNGVATAPYTITESTGEYIITAHYVGTDTYLESDSINNGLLIVEESVVEMIPTITVVDSVSGIQGTSVVLTATVYDYADNLVPDGEVYFTLNGVTITDSYGNTLYAQVHDGVAMLPYIITDAVDVYVLEAHYEGTGIYLPSDSINSATLTVEQPDAEMIPTITVVDSAIGIQGDTVDLIATVYDDEYNLVPEGEVYFIINGGIVRDSNGNILYADVVDGVAKLPYTITENAGSYIITAHFTGTSTYLASDSINSATLTVEQSTTDKIPTTTTVDSVVGVVGETVDLTATVVDNENKVVTEGIVRFEINGQTVYGEVVNGVATAPYTITESVGSYDIKAYYMGTSTYLESDGVNTGKLIVESSSTEKIPTITVVDGVTGTTGTTVNLTATVYDNDGKAVTEGQVSFKINGITVTDANGNTLYAQVSSGVARLPYTITESAGSYTITAHYEGTDKYLESDSINNEKLTVENSATEKIHTTTIVDSITATQGETVNLTATVYDESGNLVTEGQVSFEIEGVTVTDANGNILYADVHDGVARLPYTVTNDPDNYVIKATYQGTDTYYPSDSLNDAKLSVVARPDSDRIPTTTIVDDMTVVSGSTVNLTATVYDENGYLVTEGKVSFRLNGVTIKDEEGNILYADVINGIAKLPYTVINSPKNYTLEAIYTGSDLYLPSNSTTYANATLQVLDGRIPTSTIVDSVTGIQGETVNLTATVYDEYGDLVTEGDVLFKLNNVTIKDEDGNILYAEVVDGVAKLPYTITNNPKDYNISAVYMGTDTYMSSKSVNNATLTVEDTSKYKIPTITVVDSIIANKGDTVNLTATVFDNEGNLVGEGDVSFKLNGVTLKDEFGNTLYAQVENGVAKLPYTITNSPKNYTITAVYQGTDTYLSSKSVNNGTLMVLAAEDKIDTTTTVDGVTATPNETVNLTAEVTDENGDPVTEGDVYFEIDGEPITDEDGNIIYVPVINGTASIPYTPTEEGNFTITAKYNGTDKYAPSDAENTGTTGTLVVVDKNTNVTTTITVNDISQQYGDYVTFTATIVDEYGNKVTGGKVAFKLNGVTIKDEDGNVVYAEVVNGVASISYLITNNVKDYNLTAVYSGRGIFEGSRSNTATFTVTPRSVNITVDKLDNNIKSGDNVTFKATITEYDTTYTDEGVVVFKINGKTIRDEDGNPIVVDVENGVATLDYTIPVDFAGKEYNITAVYTNNNYERAEANNTLTTVRSNVQTELNQITVSQGEDANIYMVLYDENGNQLERDTKVAIKINGHTIIHMNTTEGVLNATIPASEITHTTNRIDVVLGENQGYYELRLNTTLTVKS